MVRVLLTGGSGFIGAHILDILLQHGHSVVVTVRSQEKAAQIKQAHSDIAKDKLDFAIVEDMAQEGAFDNVIISDPPFEAVIHTASPFHFNIQTSVQKDLLDPAIIGTTSILKSIQKRAPSVKRVVITSAFSSIADASKGTWPDHTYTEDDWNPITTEEAVKNAANGYRASKTFAERAAWDFVKQNNPNFTLVTMCPALVLGPILHHVKSLDGLNTSNKRIYSIFNGDSKKDLPPGAPFLWVDVRDLAKAHVLAMEKEEAANKRFLITAGHFNSKDIAEIVRENFSEYRENLPPPDVKSGGYLPGGIYRADNSRAEKILGLKWTSLEKTVVDTVRSLQTLGA